MNTKQIGDASESLVIARFVRRGFFVSRPFGDNDPYDLILDTRTELYRVQVKTGWIENECVRFKTYSKTTSNGEVDHRDYTPEDIDAYAVRCRETDDCYWIAVEDTGVKNTYLRVEPARIDHPAIRYAEDYLFENNLPELVRGTPN